jgi:hypothetical protein
VGVEVGVRGVKVIGTHAHVPETTEHAPRTHGALGQMVPGVQGGQIAHLPSQGTFAQAGGGVGVAVGDAHATAQAQPRSIVRYVQKPPASSPLGHRPWHGRASHADAHSPGAGVFGSHAHWPALVRQVPARLRGAMQGRPSHTSPQDEAAASRAGVAVGAGPTSATARGGMATRLSANTRNRNTGPILHAVAGRGQITRTVTGDRQQHLPLPPGHRRARRHGKRNKARPG